MFEIPDDDLAWTDDFTFEEDLNQHGISARPSGIATTASYHSDVSQLRCQVVGGTSRNSSCYSSTSTEPRCAVLPDKVNNFYQGNRTDAAGSTYPQPGPPKNRSTPHKRQFPGPAGVLPPCSTTAELDASLRDTRCVELQPGCQDKEAPVPQPGLIPWPQVSPDEVFSSSQWKTLVEDLGPDADSLLHKFSIKSALLKASRKLLHRGKISLIMGVVENLEMQGSDASLVIRDPTGKMNGALHQDLFQDPTTALQAGYVLVLRQVSVISPTVRTHYLNITPANVALVYRHHHQTAVSRQSWSELQADPNMSSSTGLLGFSLKQIVADSEQELAGWPKGLAQGSAQTWTSRTPTVLNGTRGLSNFQVLGPRNSPARQPAGSGFSAIDFQTKNSWTPRMPSVEVGHGAINKTLDTDVANSGRDLPSGRSCRESSVFKTKFVDPSSSVRCDISQGHSVASRSVLCKTSAGSAFTHTIGVQGHAKRSDSLRSQHDSSFDDDFPEQDEALLLQLCDQVLHHKHVNNRPEVRDREIHHMNRSVNSLPEGSEPDFHSGIDRLLKVSGEKSLSGHQFDELNKPGSFPSRENIGTCVAPNSNIITSGGIPQVQKFPSPVGNVGRKFSFKRNISSPSSSTQLPAKRVVFNEVSNNSSAGVDLFHGVPDFSTTSKTFNKNGTTISESASPFTDQHCSSNSMSVSSLTKSQVSSLGSASSNFKSLARHPKSTEESKPTSLAGLFHPPVTSWSGDPINWQEKSVHPSGGHVHTADASVSNLTTTQARQVNVLASSAGHAQADRHQLAVESQKQTCVQVTKDNSDQPTIESSISVQPLATQQRGVSLNLLAVQKPDPASLFPHWDDDLSDDLLLSQLSEEF